MISTISLYALVLQDQIATIAKDVGVKLFVPFELGKPMDSDIEGTFGQKDRFKKKLKEIGLPCTVSYTSPWTDW